MKIVRAQVLLLEENDADPRIASLVQSAEVVFQTQPTGQYELVKSMWGPTRLRPKLPPIRGRNTATAHDVIDLNKSA